MLSPQTGGGFARCRGGLVNCLVYEPFWGAILWVWWCSMNRGKGLMPDGARWLSTTLELKRDRGAGVVLASHRLQDLAGLCDAYLLLLPHESILVKAHEVDPKGVVTPALLIDVFDRLRGGVPLPKALI